MTKFVEKIVPKVFLGMFGTEHFVVLGYKKLGKKGEKGRKAKVSKAIGYNWFTKALGLPVAQKLAVVQRVIDDDYDIVNADALRKRFRKQR